MNRTAFQSVLLLWFLLASYRVEAQAPVAVTGATLHAMVSEENGRNVFRYTISRPRSSEGSIATFALDVDGSNCALQVDRTFDIQAPQGWDGTTTSALAILWDTGNASDEIRPGEIRSGFSLSTSMLPTLCTFSLKPFVDRTALDIPPPGLEGDIPAYLAKVDAAVASLSVVGTTLGPVAPPAVFDAQRFLASLIADKEQAIQLGWIKNQGIGNSLDAKLNAASASLQRGDNKTAINQLNALLNEVNAQAGKQLSAEAVALLKFNTQYLISKIP